MRLFIAGKPFAFRLPPQQTSKDTHKNLTLRLCSYINLFSCQISSYGLSLNLRRLSGYGLILASGLAFWFSPSGFYLATIVQRKMELNNCCSPDLSNDRRQNDVAGYRYKNNDGVVLTPSIGQLLFKGSAARLLCPRDLARAIQRSLSLTLVSISAIPVIWWS